VTTFLRLLFLVPLGYIAGCVAAGFMLAFGLFGYEADPETRFFFGLSVFIWTFWAGAAAFVPALVAIILGEVLAWRSVLYWLAVGGGIGLVAGQFFDRYRDLDLTDRRTVVLLAAGFVGGFAYWLVAGRLAGARDPFPPARPGESRVPQAGSSATPPRP
jgi:hypothetical protein